MHERLGRGVEPSAHLIHMIAQLPAFALTSLVLLNCVPVAACAGDFTVVPGLLNGRPGITVRASWGADGSNRVSAPRKATRPLSAVERIAFAAIGLGSALYLSDRTKDMDGFRTDIATTAVSFAIVGGITAHVHDGNMIDYVGSGLTSALVSSVADYERAMHFQEGASPLFWSALQASSMSIFENMLRGNSPYSRFGMDLGPGFLSVGLLSDESAERVSFDYQFRITSTLGAIYYASRGFEFDTHESLRTGSLVFKAEEPIGNDPDGFQSPGRAYGNTYAVYDPPARPSNPFVAHCVDVDVNWAIPAHEKTHTAQLQKLDVVLYPINVWADDNETNWRGITRWFRPAGDVGVTALHVIESGESHDDRTLERGPTSLSREIRRREGCI